MKYFGEFERIFCRDEFSLCTACTNLEFTKSVGGKGQKLIMKKQPTPNSTLIRLIGSSKFVEYDYQMQLTDHMLEGLRFSIRVTARVM